MTFPTDEDVRLWYQQHYNSGFYGLLSFMGLDSAEVFAEGWMVRAADGRELLEHEIAVVVADRHGPSLSRPARERA